ncbi:MAG: hypothetical protein C0621_09115 [Desulfuromonas sp.]|nr:MAG: hypothetical protein C0621_09115 [Desulfuromonas sp.]
MLRSFLLLVVSSWLTLVLSGCSGFVAGDRGGPPSPLPASYSQPTVGGGLQPEQLWWQRFADPRLDTLMEELFAGNLDLVAGIARLEQLEALARQSGSALLPNLSLEGSVGRARSQVLGRSVTADSYQLSPAASFEVDFWGKNRQKTKAADRDVVAARAELESLCLSLSAQLADLYFLRREQYQQLQLQRENQALLRQLLQQRERRYQRGLSDSSFLYQAQQTLAGVEAQIPLLEQGVATATRGMALLLGRTPAGESETLTPLPPLVAEFPAGLPSQLVQNRPDIIAARERLLAADARVAAAIADRFPSFNLMAAGGGASSELATLLDSGQLFWSLLLKATVPLFDGGKRRAEVERQKAVVKEKLALYQQSLLTAFNEVDEALHANASAETRVAAFAAAATAQEATLRLAVSRYAQGGIDSPALLQARLQKNEAQSALLTALRQAISNRIGLARVLGGTWMTTRLDLLRADVKKEGSSS